MEVEQVQRSQDDRLPRGLLLALAQNMRAMEQYASLDESGRARLIERAAAAQSQKEMQALISDMSDLR